MVDGDLPLPQELNLEVLPLLLSQNLPLPDQTSNYHYRSGLSELFVLELPFPLHPLRNILLTNSTNALLI